MGRASDATSCDAARRMMISSRLTFFVLIALAVAFEVVSDTLFKHWSNTDRTLWIVIGVVLYVASTVFWAFSLKHESLSKSIMVFTITNVIAVLAVGRWVFHETLSARAMAGIFLGLIGLVLMEME